MISPDQEFYAAPLAGLYKGFVRDNQDPERRGRLRCYCPQVMGDEDREEFWLDWAEPCLPWLGGLSTLDAGSPYSKTQNGGEDVGLWLMFEGGSPDFPVWLGMFTIAPTVDGKRSQLDLSTAGGQPGGSIIDNPPPGSTLDALNPPRPDETSRETRLLTKAGRDLVLGSAQGGYLILGPSGAHLVGVQVTLNGMLVNASSADKVSL